MESDNSDFDWYLSPGYIEILERFSPYGNIEEIQKDFQIGRGNIYPKPREKFELIIKRFIDASAIVECALNEKIDAVHTFPVLQKMLFTAGVDFKGKKQILIEKVIMLLPEQVESVGKLPIYKCSQSGLDIIGTFDKYEKESEKSIRDEILDLLINGKFLDAAITYKAYQAQWTSYGSNDIANYKIEEMQFQRGKYPSTLIGKFDESILAKFQGLKFLKNFWWSEPNPERVFNTVNLSVEEWETISILIDRYYKFVKEVAQDPIYARNGIWFNLSDENICPNCKKLNGTKPRRSDIRIWPFVGCTNPIGCMPLYGFFLQEFKDSEVEKVEETFGDFIDKLVGSTLIGESNQKTEKEDSELDARIVDILQNHNINSLRELKLMQEEGLITDQEYELKKKEILSKM